MIELCQSGVWVHHSYFVPIVKSLFDSRLKLIDRNCLCHHHDPDKPQQHRTVHLNNHVSLAFLSCPQTLRQVSLQAHARERA